MSPRCRNQTTSRGREHSPLRFPKSSRLRHRDVPPFPSRWLFRDLGIVLLVASVIVFAATLIVWPVLDLRYTLPGILLYLGSAILGFLLVVGWLPGGED